MLLNIERAKVTMEKYNLDGLVAVMPENVYYLSDFGFSHIFLFAQYGVAAAVLPRDENLPPTLLVSEQDIPYLEVAPTWMPEVRMIGSFGSYVSGGELTERERRISDRWAALAEKGPRSPNQQEVLATVLDEMGLAKAKLGIDDVRAMLDLRERGIARETGREAVNVFREIRLIKTPDEIEIMRRACEINQDALRTASNLLREGVTMRELRTAWRCAMVLQGATPMEFYAGGFDRPWPMGDESYRMKSGDHLMLDCAGTYRWYWTDFGRTGTVGPPSGKVLNVHGGLLKAYDACVPLLRPGVSSGEIKRAAREAAPELVRGLITLMHPLGVELYGMPQPYGELLREDFALEAGMVLNLECCLYFEFPWGVMQLEDTFLIREEGPELFGTLPKTILGPDARDARSA